MEIPTSYAAPHCGTDHQSHGGVNAPSRSPTEGDLVPLSVGIKDSVAARLTSQRL